jgi:hypothetical protein
VLPKVAGGGLDFIIRPDSGDGGPATATELGLPRSVALDPGGDLFIAANGVRKVTPDGTISTLIRVGGVFGLASDSAGNVYSANQLQVSLTAPDGTTTVVAGNGKCCGISSGDGGPATAASFTAAGLALDPASNLYIADWVNNNVRKVSPNGMINTIAGNGKQGFSGDGGQATGAALRNPNGISVDANGNLYIADRSNNRIRMVTPDGAITTVAGTGAAGYSGDGGLATNAVLNQPSWVLADPSGNLFIGDAGNNRIRKILAAKAAYTLDVASLNFFAITGGAPSPSQPVGVSSTIAGLAFSVAASDPWITVTPGKGVMAASLQVTTDPSQLAPGTYSGTVTINAPLADPPVQIVSVFFTVAAANPPKLTVDPSSLSLSLPQQSAPAQKSFVVSNTGSGSLTFSASPTSDKGWLKVLVPNNTALPNAPGAVNVTADPTGLAAGTYNGSVAVTSPTIGETANIPVTLTVTAVSRPSILLSQTGISFRSAVNSCASISGACTEDLPQCFAVLNTGQGALTFNVSADVPWLQVGPGTCPYKSVSSPSSPPEVVAVLHAGTLAPGSYTGHVQVTSPQADNSPQTVLVKLTVLAAADSVGPIVRPTGLVFAGPQGQTPGSLDIGLYNFFQQSFHYASAPLFLEGNGWFSYAPGTGDLKSSQLSADLKVYPDFSGLSNGTFHGSISVQTIFGVQPVEVLAAVSGGATPSSKSERAATGCAPSALNGIFTVVPPEFNAQLGQPFPLEVYVADDCGAPLTSGSVVTSFDNGDPGINLVSLQDGRWAGTWMPQHAPAGNRVQISIHVATQGTRLSSDFRRSGNLQ